MFPNNSLPSILITQVLILAQDELGQNGTTTAYMLIIRLYYWKGLKTCINKYIKQSLPYQEKYKVGQVCSVIFFCTQVTHAVHIHGSYWSL